MHLEIFLKFYCFYYLQAKYISMCIEEIKLELRQDNINVKCNAVAKLTYVSYWIRFEAHLSFAFEKLICRNVVPAIFHNYSWYFAQSNITFHWQIQMLGYDISWAGFNIIEVMSSSRFTCKRIGYLAASQCFHPDSEVCARRKTYCCLNCWVRT